MAKDDVRITYEIDDGYVGGHRPHTVMIPFDELAECDSAAEVEERIDQYVDDHFRENYGAYWNRDQLDGLWSRIEDARRAGAAS